MSSFLEERGEVHEQVEHEEAFKQINVCIYIYIYIC